MNRTDHERTPGENRVPKPYPACPCLLNTSLNHPNLMNYDYCIIHTVYSKTCSTVILKAYERHILFLFLITAQSRTVSRQQ